MKGSKFSWLCSWYLPEKLMVAMTFPPQLISSSVSEAVHCGLIYRRLFHLWMLAIGLHLSPPLWPGSNINLRSMVNDKKKKMGTAEICPNSANINSVNQVPSPVVLQPLRGYSLMKWVCTHVYVYISMHLCLSVCIQCVYLELDKHKHTKSPFKIKTSHYLHNLMGSSHLYHYTDLIFTKLSSAPKAILYSGVSSSMSMSSSTVQISLLFKMLKWYML